MILVSSFSITQFSLLLYPILYMYFHPVVWSEDIRSYTDDVSIGLSELIAKVWHA